MAERAAALGGRLEIEVWRVPDRNLVRKVRETRVGQGGIDAFMHAYELSSKEGVVLMCLAEALLRIPDPETANMLIRDKLRDAEGQLLVTVRGKGYRWKAP